MHAVKHSGAGSDLETMSSEVSDHCDDVMTTSDAVLNEVVWSESRDLIADRRAGDRRTSDRRIYSTAVRFMAEDHIEHIGELRNISASGLLIESASLPTRHDKLIVYVEEFGRFEGSVVRVKDPLFSMAMELSVSKRNRLENTLQKFFSEPENPPPDISGRRGAIEDRRESERYQGPGDENVIGTMSDGTVFRCQILNISLGGAEVKTDATLEIGRHVRIGMICGVIKRKTKEGYALVLS